MFSKTSNDTCTYPQYLLLSVLLKLICRASVAFQETNYAVKLKLNFTNGFSGGGGGWGGGGWGVDEIYYKNFPGAL